MSHIGLPPVGLAVIGAGYWGPNLVRTALGTPALQLEWLCDLDEKRARAVLGRYTTVKTTASYDQVLADPAVSAVAIATPAATHFDLVRAALEAGKHVLVEKPLTSSVSDGEKLAALAERSGLVLMCDHTYCYTPAVQKMHQLVAEGMLGDCVQQHLLDSALHRAKPKLSSSSPSAWSSSKDVKAAARRQPLEGPSPRWRAKAIALETLWVSASVARSDAISFNAYWRCPPAERPGCGKP